MEDMLFILTVVYGMMKPAMSLEKSLIERFNQYFKDRTESFDDYYPCMQIECNLFHVHNWIQFFVSIYNNKTFENYFINELNERGEYILS